jgi:uncharacterized LabA/DUF88 family protein
MKRKAIVGFFSDHSNLYQRLKEIVGPSARINYEAISDFASRYGQMEVAKLFAPWSLRNGENHFFLSVKEKGIEVVREPLRIRNDGSYSGNLDALIAYDIGRYADLLKVVIISSGDGDFAPLVRRLRQQGKLVIIIGVDDGSISDDLRIEADETYLVSEIPGLLEYSNNDS